MSNRKAILISNPRTGRYARRPSHQVEQLAAQLISQGVDVELHKTNAPGHATELAARAANNGTTDVIVAGGDGTINEAVQGMAGGKARLGIIPQGTANVLARELDLPLVREDSIGVIVRGHSRSIHLGVAIDEATNLRRHFLLMAGIGLDASIVSRVHPSLKKHIGKAAFWISGLSHLANWQPPRFTLEVEGKSCNATFAAIGNAARYGGDLSITPRARIDRPQFEVCVIETANRFRYLHFLSRAMRGVLAESGSGVEFLQASVVRATGNAPVQVDGELIGQLPMRFEISPFALEVLVP
ncbi:MAG: diacylglycerol kinase family protein [Pyrinomonadaceae bacterium]